MLGSVARGEHLLTHSECEVLEKFDPRHFQVEEEKEGNRSSHTTGAAIPNLKIITTSPIAERARPNIVNSDMSTRQTAYNRMSSF